MNKKLLQILFAFLLLLPVVTRAQSQTTTTLFDFGSSWKYLDNGSNAGLPSVWAAPGFTDASWSSGTGYFGYGDPWITTCVNACGSVDCNPSCGTKYVTTYFRKTINIADTALFDSVRFSAYRDDGIVVYVNGVEVWRDNMPTGTIAYNTLANSPAIGGADETTPVTRSIPISAFISGSNTIAVELHQQATNSSDLTFNMQALGVIRTKIFSYGAPWKYLIATTDQGTPWRQTSFSDAAWSVGTGHIGFGETWTTTCIPAGPTGCTAGCMPGSSCTKYTTTYFRKAVNLPDLSVYDSVKFSMFRDDGIVMYVNGVEVWRDNMPTGTISYSTLAPNNITGTTGVYAESLAVVKAIPVSAFTNGNNIIAIELHQNSATSSDLDFNVQMTGVLRAPAVPVTLFQGPYLQMGNKTAVSVRWRTNVASKSRLQVGTVAGTYPIVVNDATSVTEHEVRVTGLQPDTKYFYRIGTDTSIIQGDTSNFFVTAPADNATRRVTIAAFGDCGRNDNSFQTGSLASYQNYLSTHNMKAADLMLLVGDNAYDAGTDAEFSANFFSRYSGNILKNHMLFPAPGNHDYANNATRQVDHNVPYFDLFSVPTAAECGGVASGTEAYYSYDWGNVHILSLDSYGEENGGTTRLYDTLGAQVNWIKNDLAANNKKWTIVYFHHPPYTMGSHNSDNEGELVNIRQNFIRILERYGVDMVICGHSHDYERSYLLKGHYGSEASFSKTAHAADSSSAKYNGSTNSCPYTIPSGKVNHGTVYVVSGSAGADGGVQAGYPHNAMPFSIDDGGMFFLDINDNRLDAKFLRRDNSVADQFTIVKDTKVQDTVTILAGQSATLTASWPGAYAWAPGVTSRTVSVTPLNDTTVFVKDSLTNTCLSDRHYIDVQCTMPAFTTCPGNIQHLGCDPVVGYSVADTGRPAPSLNYAFSGATVASGSGTGSGYTFNVGITTVTLTATNSCGSATCSFTVTIDPLPAVYNVTGTGGYCVGQSGVSVGLDNSQSGVSYTLYNGATAVGGPVAGTGAPILFGTYAAGTYSVLATDITTSCTQRMAGSAVVTQHALPGVYNVTGTGSYCAGAGGVSVGLSNSDNGVNYQLYDGAATVGSLVAGNGSAISFGSFTTATTYTVAAVNATTGCASNMNGSATISIDPLPATFTVTGGGHYCDGGTGMPVGLSNSETGINYTLYNGATQAGLTVAGTTGTAITFGAFTTAATYTAVATNQFTGCSSNMSAAALINIDPLPVAYTVTGGGHYCAGATGVAVGLNNSQSDVSYQLYSAAGATGTPVAGTAAAITFGSQTVAGTYMVVATNTLTTCVNNMNSTISVIIDPLPAVYSVTGGGSYCAGGAGVVVGLGGSSTAINYQLYNGITAVGGAIAGTGSPISFGLHTVAGTYSLSASNPLTGCTNNMMGSVDVAVIPVVTPSVSVNAASGLSLCDGASNTFTALGMNGGAAPAYQWSVNGTNTVATASYTYVPHNNDIVKIIMTSSAACATVATVSATVTLTVNPFVMPVASISASPGSNVCDGNRITFNAATLHGGTAPIYTWLKNTAIVGTGTSYSYFPADGDDIILSLTSNKPCRLATTVYSNNISMTVGERYMPSVDLVITPGTTVKPGQRDTLTAIVTNGGPAPVYKWIVNNTVIAGATNASFSSNTFADNDSVTCVVTGSGTCGLQTFNSVVLHVNSLGLGSVSYGQGSIQIMPNPNSGEFAIRGSLGTKVDEDVALTVTNVLGQVVYRNKIQAVKGELDQHIYLGNTLASGTYILNVNTASENKMFHFVVSK